MFVLYNSSYSTCSQKVRICLAEKGVEFTEIKLRLDKKEQLDPAYIKLNPNAVVPTLVHDGRPIVDSSVICEYLDEIIPEPSLSPADPYERARMRSWMRYIEEVPTAAIRMPSINRCIINRFDGLSQEAFEKDEISIRPIRRELFRRMGKPTGFSNADIDSSLDLLKGTCKRMQDALEGGPWIMGGQFTIADIIVAPTIDRMMDIELSWIWDDYPRVQEWYDRIRERPSYRAAYYPGSRFSEFFQLRPLYPDKEAAALAG
ncbi:MAG: glutathione S-transferase family protein [Rhizobiaceae bacterium]